MAQIPIQEGYVDVTGGRIWYKMVGDGDGTPLVTVHGGPGFPHNSLEPLAALSDERPVIFYDQLGCGKSDRPEDTSLWRIERFVEELELLRTALGFERINILGHSWGTMLATDYALMYQERVEKLMLSSPALSVFVWAKEAARLVANLPHEMQELLIRYDRGEQVDSDAYEAAYTEYMRRHYCRLDELPEPIQQARQGFNMTVYETMWGRSELSSTGNLKDYDRTNRLRELRLPVLLTCGRYDEATPEAVTHYLSLIPGAQMAVFENSAHVPQWEDQDDYLRVVREFFG